MAYMQNGWKVFSQYQDCVFDLKHRWARDLGSEEHTETVILPGRQVWHHKPVPNERHALKAKFISTTVKNSVRTSKKTQHFSITKVNLLMLSK
jgi:hypothetical protein